MLNSGGAIVEAFHWRAAYLAVKAHEVRVVKRREWNRLTVPLHEVSNAYSEGDFGGEFL
jgi:hypothetical protein